MGPVAGVVGAEAGALGAAGEPAGVVVAVFDGAAECGVGVAGSAAEVEDGVVAVEAEADAGVARESADGFGGDGMPVDGGLAGGVFGEGVDVDVDDDFDAGSGGVGFEVGVDDRGEAVDAFRVRFRAGIAGKFAGRMVDGVEQAAGEVGREAAGDGDGVVVVGVHGDVGGVHGGAGAVGVGRPTRGDVGAGDVFELVGGGVVGEFDGVGLVARGDEAGERTDFGIGEAAVGEGGVGFGEVGQGDGDADVFLGGAGADATFPGDPVGHAAGLPRFPGAAAVEFRDDVEEATHGGGEVAGEGGRFGFEPFGGGGREVRVGDECGGHGGLQTSTMTGRIGVDRTTRVRPRSGAPDPNAFRGTPRNWNIRGVSGVPVGCARPNSE